MHVLQSTPKLARHALVLGLLALLGCELPTPASLSFVGVSPPEPRIGESATVRFAAFDGSGRPLAGVPIEFAIQGGENPAVNLSPAVALTDRETGTASTTLTTTGQVASVRVVATVGEVSAMSSAVSFAGSSTASARQLTFQCGPISGEASGGVHAIGAYDETRHLIAGVKLDCTAHVADRNGDGIRGAVVSFLTEAGTIDPSGTTLSDVAGNATILYKTSLPLPKDVDPGVFTLTPQVDSVHTGELIAPLWMHPFAWVENPILDYGTPPALNPLEPSRIDPITGKENNPRDNLVSIIAVTAGEEAFDDLDNNGVWDEGEPYEDLTEPFVDSNDNGTWDPGERWVDTNANGAWDGKNNRFDADTLIWRQERILWTGIPHPLDVDDPVAPVFDVVNPGVTVPGLGTSDEIVVLMADPWFNSLAQNADGDGCRASEAEGEELVVPVPSQFEAGRAFTYPSYRELIFRLKDPAEADDPNIPLRPLDFVQSFNCTFTASPNEGHIVGINFSVAGTLLAPPP